MILPELEASVISVSRSIQNHNNDGVGGDAQIHEMLVLGLPRMSSRSHSSSHLLCIV